MSKKKEAQMNPPQQINPNEIVVISQYIKDLSFENPRVLGLSQDSDQPNIAVNIETATRKMSENIYEVVLSLRVEAQQAKNTLFLAELAYAGLFNISDTLQEHLEPILLVECPRLLFPFARNIIADVVRDGGFPPLLLNPIDFARLYIERKTGKNMDELAAETAALPQDNVTQH
jgi:preprotein translocase subunit SecB